MSTVGNPTTQKKLTAAQLNKQKRVQKKAKAAANELALAKEKEKRAANKLESDQFTDQLKARCAQEKEAAIQRKAERAVERAAEDAARATKAAAKMAEKAAQEKTNADKPSKVSIATTSSSLLVNEPSADDDDLVIATSTLQPSVVVQPPKINPSAEFLAAYSELQIYFDTLEKRLKTNVLSISQLLTKEGSAEEKRARIKDVQKLKKAILDDLFSDKKPLLAILDKIAQILSGHSDLIPSVHIATIANILNNYSILHDALQEQLIIHFSRIAKVEKFIPLTVFNQFISACARLGIQELELSPEDGLDFIQSLHSAFIKSLKSTFVSLGSKYNSKYNRIDQVSSADKKMGQEVSEILDAFIGLYGFFKSYESMYAKTIKDLQKNIIEELSIHLPLDNSNSNNKFNKAINEVIFNEPANSLLHLCNSLNRFYHRYKIENLELDSTDMETLEDYLYNKPNSGKTLVQGSNTQDHFFFDLVRIFELQNKQLETQINQRIQVFKSKSGNMDADNHIQAGAIFSLKYPNQRINLTYEMRVGDPWGVSVDIAVGIQDSKEASETLHLYEIDAHPSHHIIRVRRDGIICNNHLNGIDHSKRMFVLDNKKGAASSKGTIVSYTNVNEDYYEYSKMRSYSAGRLAFVASLLPQATAVNSLVYFNSKYCVCFGYPIQPKDSIASSAKSVTSTNPSSKELDEGEHLTKNTKALTFVAPHSQPTYFGMATTSTQQLQCNTKGRVLTTH